MNLQTLTLLIAASGLLISMSSLLTSILAYRRDKGALVFYIGLGEIISIQNPQDKTSTLQLKLTNVGRRPVTIMGIYGDLKRQQLKKIINWLLEFRTPDCLKPQGYILPNRTLISQLMPDGKAQTLHEGEEASILINGSEGNLLAKSIAKSAGNLYVMDSTGRKHYVASRWMRKLRFDSK